VSRRAFILIGLFWLALIGGLLGFKEYTLRTGQEVLLRTVPVDPRDLFRGDYVILQYELSTFPAAELGVDPERPAPWYNRQYYVSLEVEDGYASATGVYQNKPDGLFLKGRIMNIRNEEAMLDYGISSYFVPEGRGHEIERGDQRPDVRVSIDKFGNAVILALVVDGEDIAF
jgi:uncharacterized membrane-anchored protein